MNPQDVPLTRDVVTRWLDEWEKLDPQPDVRVFLAGKINNLELDNVMVNTQAHDDLEDETSLLEMVIRDLPSYGISQV
jgi:hypothetical protein